MKIYDENKQTKKELEIKLEQIDRDRIDVMFGIEGFNEFSSLISIYKCDDGLIRYRLNGIKHENRLYDDLMVKGDVRFTVDTDNGLPFMGYLEKVGDNDD